MTCLAEMMAEDDAAAKADPQLVAQIVGSYVRHNRIAADQVGDLIAAVGQSLAALGHQTLPEPEEAARAPAVPIRRSVQRDYVVCLECGYRGKVLRRHLAIRHGLDPDAYRTRWKLSADHPLVAPGYSERRSALAKQLGLGRPAGAESDASATATASENGLPVGAAEPEPALAAAAPSAPPRPQPRRRGRSRRSQGQGADNVR
jgi:predicted transcriptional regulator